MSGRLSQRVYEIGACGRHCVRTREMWVRLVMNCMQTLHTQINGRKIVGRLKVRQLQRHSKREQRQPKTVCNLDIEIACLLIFKKIFFKTVIKNFRFFFFFSFSLFVF